MSGLNFPMGPSAPVVVIVADTNYTCTGAEDLISYTNLTANRTVTLPAFSARPAGAPLTIKTGGAGSSSNSIIVASPDAGAYLDSLSLPTTVPASAWRSLTVVSNGTRWLITAYY